MGFLCACFSEVVPSIKTRRHLNSYNLFLFEGTPRASVEAFDEGHKYGKQIKRESPPISKGQGVTTIKEMGRSIHEIPRQDLLGQDNRKTPDGVQNTRPVIEGSISQVRTGDRNQ